MNSPKLIESLKKINWSEHLATVCQKGQFESVKNALTAPIIKDMIDINFRDNLPLANACSSGNLEIVQYLLTSPEIVQHSNYGFFAVKVAVSTGCKNIVQYFYENPKYKFNPHDENNVLLTIAIRQEKKEMADYLINAFFSLEELALYLNQYKSSHQYYVKEIIYLEKMLTNKINQSKEDILPIATLNELNKNKIKIL